MNDVEIINFLSFASLFFLLTGSSLANTGICRLNCLLTTRKQAPHRYLPLNIGPLELRIA